MTGVYGFQEGVMSYGLKENGSAFFGASGNGRIEIDGTSGIIRSTGWTKSENDWTLSSKTGTLIDLNDGMLLMKGKGDSYLYFNKDKENGILEMSLSGANIKLTDKSNTPGLSGYIDATAKGLVTEFRRTAIYAVTCNTKDSTATKTLNLNDFTQNDFFNSDTDEKDENTVGALSADDIQKDGVTIAVTFIEPETVTTE